MIRPQSKNRIIIPKRRWLFPISCEREYMRLVDCIPRMLREAAREELPTLSGMVERNPMRQDGMKEEVAILMRAMRQRFRDKAERFRVEAELKKLAMQTESFNARQFQAVMRSAMKVDIYQHEPWLRDLTEMWVEENVRLIKTIPDMFFEDIEGIVARGMMDGDSNDDMSQRIMDHVDISKRKGRLIARDQIGKLNGDITKYRQTGVGIESYVWSTSKDGRVRPEHADREGRTYRWNDPPKGGHPGKAIYCRCVALPVIDMDKIRYMAVM